MPTGKGHDTVSLRRRFTIATVATYLVGGIGGAAARGTEPALGIVMVLPFLVAVFIYYFLVFAPGPALFVGVLLETVAIAYAALTLLAGSGVSLGGWDLLVFSFGLEIALLSSVVGAIMSRRSESDRA